MNEKNDITLEEFKKDTNEFFTKVAKTLGPIIVLVVLTLIFL